MFKNKKINKTTAIIASFVIVILTAVCVFAYQAMRSDDTINIVTAEKLNAKIIEVIDEGHKESIVVTADNDNTGNVKVRVAVVPQYKASNNRYVYPKQPPDLTPYINTDDWIPTIFAVDDNGMYSDIYYVYNHELEPGESTTNLLKTPINMAEYTFVDEDGQEWNLVIDVLMQAAEPETFEGSVMK